MKKNGIVLTQSGSFPSMLSATKFIKRNLKKVFPFVELHLGVVPTYGVGLYTFALGSKKKLNLNLKTIQKRYKKLKLNTKYYNPEIHLASGYLPNLLK